MHLLIHKNTIYRSKKNLRHKEKTDVMCVCFPCIFWPHVFQCSSGPNQWPGSQRGSELVFWWVQQMWTYHDTLETSGVFSSNKEYTRTWDNSDTQHNQDAVLKAEDKIRLFENEMLCWSCNLHQFYIWIKTVLYLIFNIKQQ